MKEDKTESAKAKQRANVSYMPGDVIEIYGPCKLVHVGGRGGRFNAFLPAAVKKPRVRRGKRLAKSKGKV